MSPHCQKMQYLLPDFLAKTPQVLLSMWSEVCYYSCTSVYLNAPAMYVFFKMRIFKVIHFIFWTSKTVEWESTRVRCKSKYNSNKIFNLFKVTKKISASRLKKLQQLKFSHAILRSCFLQELAFFFLAFPSSLSSFAISTPHIFPVLNL